MSIEDTLIKDTKGKEEPTTLELKGTAVTVTGGHTEGKG